MDEELVEGLGVLVADFAGVGVAIQCNSGLLLAVEGIRAVPVDEVVELYHSSNLTAIPVLLLVLLYFLLQFLLNFFTRFTLFE